MKRKIGSVYNITIERADGSTYDQNLFVKNGQDPLKIAKLYEKIRLGKGYLVLLHSMYKIRDEYEESSDKKQKEKEGK